MACYHPLVAFVVGVKSDGKKILKFAKKGERLQDVYIDDRGVAHPEIEKLLLPCGKCIGCLMKRSMDWSVRMMHELEDHDRACFITLTYDDDNVPVNNYVDENGEVKKSLTLCKPDFQKFMKRLRKHYTGNTIRFFACGEYGSKTRRPHYHAIIYGVDFSEDRYIWKVEDGFVNYRSPTLEKLWPFGNSLIAEVNMNTCAYVARYCTKKKYGRQNIYYQLFNIEPEFNLMSRRPGIGSNWLGLHKDEIYPDGYIYMKNNKGGLKLKPPKYYDKLFEIYEPELMENIKEKRKEKANDAMALRLNDTSMDMFTMLENDERAFLERISTLQRKKV